MRVGFMICVHSPEFATRQAAAPPLFCKLISAGAINDPGSRATNRTRLTNASLAWNVGSAADRETRQTRRAFKRERMLYATTTSLFVVTITIVSFFHFNGRVPASLCQLCLVLVCCVYVPVSEPFPRQSLGTGLH